MFVSRVLFARASLHNIQRRDDRVDSTPQNEWDPPYLCPIQSTSPQHKKQYTEWMSTKEREYVHVTAM
jgi:hypothetical protein